jgi:uncharacterized protein YlzI (FlbEa/FlbD family)
MIEGNGNMLELNGNMLELNGKMLELNGKMLELNGNIIEGFCRFPDVSGGISAENGVALWGIDGVDAIGAAKTKVGIFVVKRRSS